MLSDVTCFQSFSLMPLLTTSFLIGTIVGPTLLVRVTIVGPRFLVVASRSRVATELFLTCMFPARQAEGIINSLGGDYDFITTFSRNLLDFKSRAEFTCKVFPWCPANRMLH